MTTTTATMPVDGAWNWQPDVKSPAPVNGHTPAAKGDDASTTKARLANLPEDFWQARPRFALIRQAAWRAGCGADMCLLGVLCRLSAMRSHELMFDLGRGVGSLNLYGGAIGGTGLGKSIANSTAKKMLLVPAYLALDREGREADSSKFLDGIGLGTGEGLAESLMGMVEEPTGEVHTRDTKGANKGDPKTRPVRKQTRHHTYFYVDEGQKLTTLMLERQGATIGSAIRSSWVAAALGEQNAKDETTRLIAEHSYAMGMVIGYQPKLVQALLADGAAGTPQRYLWMSGYDPAFPSTRPDPVMPFHLPLAGPDGKAIKGIIDGPTWLAEKLWAERVEIVHGDEEVEELDSHEPIMRCKLAALLALIDERMTVNDEDWQLADVLWTTSCAIRDEMGEIGKREAAVKARQKNEAQAEAALTAHSKVKEYDSNVGRVARNIARKVYKVTIEADADKALKSVTERWPYREIDKRDRPHYDAGLSLATAAGWLVLEDGSLAPGASRP